MKTRTKATAIILTAVIVLSAFSVCGTAYAAEIPIPKQYDSRDYGYITPVRNQLAYGTCWAHGTIAACEASLVKNNGFSNDLDLAEFHLAYAAMHKMFDRLGLFDSEFYVDPSKKYMSDGNSLDAATITLACWNGAVLDSAHREQFSSKKFDYNGLDQLDFASQELLYSINAVKLTDYVNIESKDSDSVKKHIMQYGGGAFAINAPSEGIDGERGIWITDDSFSFTDSHAMCVVGWDDTIPASDLTVSGVTPEGDGAYIVKNSWGEETGNDGYYYIPYRSFECDDGETLEAVSFFPYGNEKSYEIKVYTRLPEDAESPESGTLSAVQTGGALEKGYRTFPLNNPISLKSGERFSVVITVTTEGDDVFDNLAQFATNAPEIANKKDVNAQPKRGESYFYTASEGWQDVCDLGYNNTRIKALTHSDAAPTLVEPDDYDSYNGVSKADLITQFNDLMPEYNQIIDNFYNYDSDYRTCLNNFKEIYDTVLSHSESFNASEIYATAQNFKYILNNTVYLNPENELENFSELAHRYLNADARYYPVEQQCYKDFVDEFNRIAHMAENLELNSSIYYDLRASLRNKLFDLQRYIGKYNARGNIKFGDVNNDGEINVLDATILQKYGADKINQNFYIVNVGDVNSDSAVNVLDAVNIQQLSANKLDHFKVYEQTFGVEDGYTAETDKATIIQYLSDAIEERSTWETYRPTIFDSEIDIYQSISYETAKEALANAENLSPAILLFEARNIIDFVYPTN